MGLIRITHGGDMRDMPELILIVCRFKQNGVADLLLFVADVTLQAFPHD